jgi:hypothetical protein
MVWQLLSISGALLILAAYAAHQLKRMHADTILYQTLNLVGGAFLFITAVVTQQAGFMLMEGSWTLMSAWGLVKVLRGARDADDITPIP